MIRLSLTELKRDYAKFYYLKGVNFYEKKGYTYS